MEERKLLLEGLLPTDVWNALIVLVILFGVFVAIFKGIVLIKDEIAKHKEKKALAGQDITDKIADKVMEKLTPQIEEKFKSFEKKVDKSFEDIDKKLANDKESIESHTRQLNEHESRVGRLEAGNDSLCQGVLALLEKDPTLSRAAHGMKNYLITGKYNEKDWE